MSATLLEVFGAGSSTFGLEGDIASQESAGISPASTASDVVMAVFNIPASSFDQPGRGVEIEAAGSFAATANNKRVKIIVGAASPTVGSTVSGGTTIADTGTVTTSGGGWFLAAGVFKYGNAGSNTQVGVNEANIAGSANAALLAPAALTLAENAVIPVCVTGNATTATSDIVLSLFKAEAED
jgi:hypothetical protein